MRYNHLINGNIISRYKKPLRLIQKLYDMFLRKTAHVALTYTGFTLQSISGLYRFINAFLIK